jgi:lysine-ketoglutarate reductase/saccharopine dehydrogenase-like protein (TIGR00300 family)
MADTTSSGRLFSEEIEVSGHIIDSLILPKVLDCITSNNGTFQIKQISVGQNRHDPSFALIEVQASAQPILDAILNQVADHGAQPTSANDCQQMKADIDGSFPEGFYATTNQQTQIRLAGDWVEVDDQEMDCGIVIEPATGKARCIPMSDVHQGMSIVVGHSGVRIFPLERSESATEFGFMSSTVSTEKPKGAMARAIARQLMEVKRTGGKTLLVGGPAIVHTGSAPFVCELVRKGYIHKLFAGNALATHDLEQSMFGTSLGVHLEDAHTAETGHEHHLRAINRVRRCGSIKAAVQQEVIRSGIMYECVKHDVDFLLAGSIRDDGPLPDVITDALQAQQQMREAVRDVTFCLMVATMLHSVAVGNLLPAWVTVVCIDINPSTVIKLGDRGSFQTTGLVTDVEPFLRALVQEINSTSGNQQ